MHTQLENTVPPADPCHYHENSRAITALTRDLSNLRCDLTQLRSELANLRCSPPNGTEACSLYVKVKQHTKDEVTNSMLCDILKCPIVSFSIICHAPQGFIQDFKLGGGNPCFVEARQTRGVWGHAPPENF